MLIAGLTGGMACGKTFVADALRDLGADVIEADRLGHEVIEPGGEARAGVLAEFGETDRAKLAAMVFGKPDELAKLNAIVHPAVRTRVRRSIEEIAARDPHAVIVYVAAILIESGGLEGMDKLIVVTCPREQQFARAMERPGATKSSVVARLEHQLPMEQKIARADYVIDTGGTKESTLVQTRMVFGQLRKLAS
jgi:dephospho-CoA kinase